MDTREALHFCIEFVEVLTKAFDLTSSNKILAENQKLKTFIDNYDWATDFYASESVQNSNNYELSINLGIKFVGILQELDILLNNLKKNDFTNACDFANDLIHLESFYSAILEHIEKH